MSVRTTESFVESPTKPSDFQQRNSPMSPSESSAASWENTATNSDVSSVDLEALCKRLNEHNSRNEVAWTLLRQQQRSVSSKQAHDVAAAARFRLRLDQIGADGVEEPVSPRTRLRTEYPHKLRRSLSTETVSSLAGNRLTRTKDSQSVLRKRKVTRPPPLRLDSLNTEPQEIQSAALPVRTSSKHAMRDYFPHEETALQRRATIAGTEQGNLRPNAKFPPRIASRAAIPKPTLQAPPTAVTAVINRPSTAPSSPTEDQLRREIERSLSESKHKTRLEQQQSRKLAQLLPAEIRNELTRTATITAATTKATTISPFENQTPEAITRIGTAPPIPVLPLIPTSTTATPSNNTITETNPVPETPAPISTTSDVPPTRCTPSPPPAELTPDISPTDTSATSSKSSLRRKKSLFGWLQKRSEVDELIDLYMNDEQLDEEPKRRPSKARLGIFRSKSNAQMGGLEEPTENKETSKLE